jgi:hypothetical protein
MRSTARRLTAAALSTLCVALTTACTSRLAPAGGRTPPVSIASPSDQLVVFPPAGLDAARTVSVGLLTPMECPWLYGDLSNSKFIGPGGDDVEVKDATGKVIARLTVPSNAVVHGDSVMFSVTVYEHPRWFIVDATRHSAGISPPGYAVELRPPCKPEDVERPDVWLVRTGAPVNEAYRRAAPTGDGAMRFRLDRLSRFVISH